MTEEKKNESMDRKQEMVKAGRIEDARVYKILYLEQAIVAEKYRAQLKERTIQDQMEQLKADRRASQQQSEQRIQGCINQTTAIRKLLAEEYQIDLELWGYDDTTGVMVPLPPDVQKQILDRRNLQKTLAEERAAEKLEAIIKAEEAEKLSQVADDDSEGANVTEENAVDNKKKLRKKRKMGEGTTEEALTDPVEA